MQQIVIIRGGTTFEKYEDYVASLKNKKVNLDWLAYSPSWRENLQGELGDGYRVYIPSMPNTANARYSEWKLYFDRVIDVLDDNIILIGHSMGSIFLAKYLSENNIDKHVKATILVAAPFDDETIEDLGDFKLSEISDRFKEQAGKVILFGAHDDPVISLDDFNKYKAALPDAVVYTLSAPDHFMRPHLPELVKAVQEL